VSGSELELEIIGPDGVPVGVVRRPPPAPRRIWLHVLLFAATLLSTTMVGGLVFGDLPAGFHPRNLAQLLFHPAVLRAGFSFSIPLLVILLTHEMGHYIACRHYRLDATLPFFIPVPFGIGTLGAFIRIRTPLLTKRELFDVGASGPIAGFVMSLPVLLLGIALSHPVAQAPTSGALIFGEPLAFKAMEWLVHPGIPPGGDLLLHPVGFAAWFGLLVTALNLLPFGQLDGGHITYALFGKLQRRAAWPLLAGLVVLGFWWPGWWVWAVIALLLRVRHPWIPDEAAPLDPRRRLLGWLCVVLFVVCFTPDPIKILR
jgi:membrane-associated protease RseP (regulator of RpoE activity)